MSCLETRDLTVRFPTPDGMLTAVDRVSIHAGARPTATAGRPEYEAGSHALVGESGCGKSVLAHAIMRLLPDGADIKGQILYHGLDLLELTEREMARVRGDNIAIVLQNASLSLNPIQTVGQQISEVYNIHRRTPQPEQRREAEALLTRLGFSDPGLKLAMYPFQLSEGMNQRVMIAAAVALGPDILIADEPTKGLDQKLKHEVIEEFRAIQQSRDTNLFLITHDLEAAQKLCHTISVMYSGEIIEQAEAADFFAAPLHPYSHALLKSLPAYGFHPIPGVAPPLLFPVSGCRFRSRCAQAQKRCQTEKPELLEISGRKVRCHLYD